MEVLKKYKLEFLLIGYWLANAANTIRVSRFPGLYPKHLRESVLLASKTWPYPWIEIFITWVVMAIITYGIYVILNKSKRIIFALLFYSVVVIFLQGLLPTDRGGVDYAIADFSICTLIIVLSFGVYSFFKNRLDRRSNVDVS